MLAEIFILTDQYLRKKWWKDESFLKHSYF